MSFIDAKDRNNNFKDFKKSLLRDQLYDDFMPMYYIFFSHITMYYFF